MQKLVAIIDYQMGNLFSVEQACRSVGLRTIKTSDVDEISQADAIILPGVGAFSEAMSNLTKLRLTKDLKEIIETGKPFMGICLGFQLLFTESEEFGRTMGLGVFEGKVKKFPPSNTFSNKIKIPQIGWNRIFSYDKEKWNNSLLKNISNNEYMYFVHSFYVESYNTEILLSHTNYEGVIYCSSIQYKHIFASQFHPEKSATEGIKIYESFAKQVMKEKS
ncbi:MAG: imidazole glycerol phosphate synthase subunit HisH [Ignavibacteriaceae bacterium]|nr:imidazole glycerol phosphate synthase subunit HisH [Ignavibacteriaceae bacterium]